MGQPLGFLDPSRPHQLCHLFQALYSLKQTPHAWHVRLAAALRVHGFVPSTADTSLFLHQQLHVTMYIYLCMWMKLFLSVSRPR
jgi:hypothetical protein